MNALTSDWYEYSDIAHNDWNTSPAIHFAVSIIAPDSEFEAIHSKMKVCNAEYAVTSLMGLNELYFEGNGARIISSVAKINEICLKRSSTGKFQHNIGHGFGWIIHDDRRITMCLMNKISLIYLRYKG